MMDSWLFEREGFDRGQAAADGNRFLLANGYMGMRGVPEGSSLSLFPAITLAGVYDQAGNRWREPVNAPNPLFFRVFFRGTLLIPEETQPVSHRASLDYRHGVYARNTNFGAAEISTRRFLSLSDPHLMADRVTLTFAEAGECVIQAGISTEIWDINGPHLGGFRFRTGDVLCAEAETGQQGITVSAAQKLLTDFPLEKETEQGAKGVFHRLRRTVQAGETLTLTLFGAVYTSLDLPAPGSAAAEACAKAARQGFEAGLAAHAEAWEQVWKASAVELLGDEEAALALHASQYYLNSAAPRHAGNLSIPARGLSGQTYKGAVFWDSEMFFFPMFVHTQPDIARSLLRYRIGTLPGALAKAAEYGYRGAFYAWESQEEGREGCTNFNVVDVFTHRPVRTYFRDKQIHISGDIAYALRAYYEITGDRRLLEEGGAKVILECARFYLSRANAHLDRESVDFADVIGPDEYHERVTNNAFTNRMIRHCLSSALDLERVFADRPEWLSDLLAEMAYEKDWELLKETVGRIRRPRIRNGVTEQFDGYLDLEDCSLDTVRSRLADPREYWGGDHGVAGTTRIIKQADVIAMMALFPEDYSDEEVAVNWAFYEPRTEHGSSLSACMYALTACRTGRLDEAWELFNRTAAIDLKGEGKQWAGEIYIGGTHPAANGGAWMIAALGFAGLRVRKGKPELHPRLPRQISKLVFPICCGEKRMTVTVTPAGGVIESGNERFLFPQAGRGE